MSREGDEEEHAVDDRFSHPFVHVRVRAEDKRRAGDEPEGSADVERVVEV